MVKRTTIKNIELVLPEAEWAARLFDCSFDEEKLGPDLAAYRAWLDESPDNFDKLEDCIEALALSRELDQDPDVMALLGEDVEAGHAEGTSTVPWWHAHRRYGLYGAIAACLALVVLNFGYFEPQSYEQLQYQTGVGEQTVYTLPDGSRVHMNTDTRLTVNYTEDYRGIHLLYGEASFDVVSDKARPFDVMSGKGRARAVGTRFNVFNDAGNVTVSVIEGVVQVASSPKEQALPAATGPKLVVGQQMTYDDAGEMSEVRLVDIERVQAWQSGRLEFLGASLSDVVREMNRYSVTPIVIGDDALKSLRVSGIFDVKETRTMLGGLEDLLPVRLLRQNNMYLIVSESSKESSL
ncbi:FecR family protein [Kordiimonas sp.]|uniref:FecR family protein n=1 Tax=Kordiimonas sp. TaxID=1970157 RepID=UPI003A8D56DF